MTDPAYTYEQAWAEAARLQRQGYVTRVWYDGSAWRVKGVTLEEWEDKQDE